MDTPGRQVSSSNEPLSRQQRTILDAILHFLRKGEIPTVREVGALVGLRSPATVLKHLRALERRQLISISGKSRGIRILREDLLRLQSSPGEGHLSAPVFRTQALGLRRLVPPALESRGVRLAGAIAAGKPFESYADGFASVGFTERGRASHEADALQIDPRIFVESGEVFALQVEGDSMVQAGILNGDYVIIRRQDSVDEGDIAAVIINGEGTLKRWRTRSPSGDPMDEELRPSLSLVPENDAFEPIEIREDDAKDVLVLGKYVGLVRGGLRF